MSESESLGGLKRNLCGGTNDAPGLVPDRFQDEKKCIDKNLTELGSTRPNDTFPMKAKKNLLLLENLKTPCHTCDGRC